MNSEDYHRMAAARADSPAPTGSATWPVVSDFAERMEEKLAKNRHKGDRKGWLKDHPIDLWNRLDEESTELYAALKNENSTFEEIANEAADVANFAMMIADIMTQRQLACERGRAQSQTAKLTDRRDEL